MLLCLDLFTFHFILRYLLSSIFILYSFLSIYQTFGRQKFFKFFNRYSPVYDSLTLMSREMSNTLEKREHIINFQGRVEKERDISRDARRSVSFLRFPNPRGFICFSRRGSWLFPAINCYYSHHARGLLARKTVVAVYSRKRSSAVFAFSWIAKSL